MVIKLAEAVNNGSLEKSIAVEFAKKQKFKENGYILNYEDIDKKSNIIKRKEDIDYRIDIINKDSKILQNDYINPESTHVNNRIAVKDMLTTKAVQGFAKRNKLIYNTFDDTVEYAQELFMRLLNTIKYHMGGKSITDLEVLGSAVRVNKKLVDLNGIFTSSSVDSTLKMADIFDVNILMDVFNELRTLVIDRDVLESILLKSETANPVDDLFRNSNIQKIVIRMPNTKVIVFNCTDTEESIKQLWLNLRNQLMNKQKLHLAAQLPYMVKWEPKFYREVLELSKYGNEATNVIKTKMQVPQGNVIDKLFSRFNKIVKKPKDARADDSTSVQTDDSLVPKEGEVANGTENEISTEQS